MPVPDISEPVKDRGHEALRQELLASIATGQENAIGVDDAYFLTDLLFDLLNAASAQIGGLQTGLANLLGAYAQLSALQDTVTDLVDRVAALEPAPTEPTP
jgi:hypothetical protein